MSTDFFFFNLFIYFWLCWVFVSVRGLPPVVASGDHSSSRCAGLSLSRPLLLRSTGSRRAGSVAVAHGLSCSAACGIFPDQGSNPCLLHWQADSQPLRHQGSPPQIFWYSSPRGWENLVCSIGWTQSFSSLSRIWKGKNCNIVVEKPGRHHLYQVLKFNITNNNFMYIMPLIWCSEKRTSPWWYSS